MVVVARVARCWVKSRNERNPVFVASGAAGTKETAGDNSRKVGMTSNHGPMSPYTRYNGLYNGHDGAIPSQP